ncbi:MAG TPA: alpha-amylase family glycosyl hydrolase, partial [Lysobacter sp.]|nr:alpha-amylase family glycosyl hydrolase [Lysobacter sp.]
MRSRSGWQWGAALAATVAAIGAARAGAAAPPELRLHVPSPDWRDQVVYFVMIDRFADGDPHNNDQGAGEYDPASGAKYSGGDLRGLTERIDYIRGLGATAVWITPPVANQWWNTRVRYGGYHGYWARDFKAVDPHFGTLDDYRRLSDRLHRAGMYLIQDVVVNHTADYLHYPAPGAAPQRVADSAGHRAPSQPPFDRNDPADPAQRAQAIYHWTPDIADFDDPRQVLDRQLSGLDDLNTENPAVRRALRDSYGFWIREVGVDAFRVDTAFYVPPAYFRDFLHAEDPAAPGVLAVAHATGRRDFHLFGEGFALDPPFEDAQMRRIDAYMRDAQGPLLPAMIQFPLYGTLGDVFARGRPPAELADRIERTLRVHADPHRMPTFVDNHDVDRFLRHGSEAALKQALLAILTLPGIPVIYYGTEQGFSEQRAAMFAGGYGSGGRDRFDTSAPLYRFLQETIALRRAHAVFRRGVPHILDASTAAPGVLAYAMAHEGETAVVLFNTADVPVLVDGLETRLAPGTVLAPLFALGDARRAPVVAAGGRLTLSLPPRAVHVWKAGAPGAVPAAPPAAITLDPAPATVAGDFALSGHAHGTRRLRLVVDGDLAHAAPVQVDDDGRWRARVDTAAMADARVLHSAVLWAEDAGAVSPRHRFRVEPAWRALASVEDPA